jgi:hypothetical protein
MRGVDSHRRTLSGTVCPGKKFAALSRRLQYIRTWLNQALARKDRRFEAMYEVDIKGEACPKSIASEKTNARDTAAAFL